MNTDWIIVGAIMFHAFKREIMTEVYRLKRWIGGRWHG